MRRQSTNSEWVRGQFTNIIIQVGGKMKVERSWNPLGDMVQGNIGSSVMDNELPSTFGAFQTVEYPFPSEKVHTEEARPTIKIIQPWAILAPLLEGGPVFCFIHWHLIRPRFLLVLAINRVEHVDAPKAFRALNDKRTNVGTVDHNRRESTVRADRELAVLLGQCKEMYRSVIFDVV